MTTLRRLFPAPPCNHEGCGWRCRFDDPSTKAQELAKEREEQIGLEAAWPRGEE